MIDELQTEDELTQDEARIIALAKHLKCDPDELEASSYDDQTIIVNEHRAKQGTSPDKARELVALVRRALKIVVDDNPAVRPMMVNDMLPLPRFLEIHTPDWTTKTFKQGAADNKRRKHPFGDSGDIFPCYDELVRLIRNNPEAQELTKIGIHDLINTLYYLCPDTDNQATAANHRDTLREAFNGQPVKDRRETVTTDDGEYLVVTDDEADELWDQDLENYIDDCLEIPTAMEGYFDREAWKKDARSDGRAHSLSRYDGNEDEAEAGNYEFYIYRVN